MITTDRQAELREQFQAILNGVEKRVDAVLLELDLYKAALRAGGDKLYYDMRDYCHMLPEGTEDSVSMEALGNLASAYLREEQRCGEEFDKASKEVEGKIAAIEAETKENGLTNFIGKLNNVEELMFTSRMLSQASLRLATQNLFKDKETGVEVTALGGITNQDSDGSGMGLIQSIMAVIAAGNNDPDDVFQDIVDAGTRKESTSE